MTPNAQLTKEKIKLDSIKSQTFYASKDTINKVKRHRWEKIHIMCLMRDLYPMHKEHLQLNNKKTIQLKMGKGPAIFKAKVTVNIFLNYFLRHKLFFEGKKITYVYQGQKSDCSLRFAPVSPEQGIKWISFLGLKPTFFKNGTSFSLHSSYL